MYTPYNQYVGGFVTDILRLYNWFEQLTEAMGNVIGNQKHELLSLRTPKKFGVGVLV